MLASCRNEIVYHLFSGFGHPKKGLNKTLNLDLHKMLGKSKQYFPTSRWNLVIYHRICKESPTIQTKSLQASQNGDVFNRGALYYQTQKTMHFEGQNVPKWPRRFASSFHSFHSSKYGSYIIWSNYNVSPNLDFPELAEGPMGTQTNYNTNLRGPKLLLREPRANLTRFKKSLFQLDDEPNL